MTREELSDALNGLKDDILEETNALRNQKKKVSYNRGKWAAVAAGIAVLVFVGIQTLPRQSADYNSKLPKLAVSNILGDGMGSGTLMAYDISELVDGNPWKPEMELKTLPVYKNQVTWDDSYRITGGGDEDVMTSLIYDYAEKLGSKVNGYIGSNQRKALFAEIDGGKITVEQSLETTIWLDATVELPKEYRFEKAPKASYEEAQKLAEYLKEEYDYLIGLDNPQVSIKGGDYSYAGEQMGYQISFFEAGETPEEQIVNYHCKRATFSCDDEGNLFLFRKFQPDLSQKMGDYPILTATEAKERLMEGDYMTAVPYEISDEEKVVKVELVYRGGDYEEYYMPYYQFSVELPKEEMGNAMLPEKSAKNLKNYGIYYVPAVKPEYLDETP